MCAIFPPVTDYATMVVIDLRIATGSIVIVAAGCHWHPYFDRHLLFF